MTHESFALHGLLSLHAAMRRDVARLARRAAQRPTGVEVASLAQWFAHFRSRLEEHHRLEDDRFLPTLVARDPSLAPDLAALEDDHRAMAALLTRTGAELAAGGGTDLVLVSVALAVLVHRHLAAEEALVVPATARLVSVAEQQAFDVELRSRLSLTELGFALPWGERRHGQVASWTCAANHQGSRERRLRPRVRIAAGHRSLERLP